MAETIAVQLGKYAYSINVSKQNKNEMLAGRCWTAGCGKPYQYIHTTSGVTADYGYCHACFVERYSKFWGGYFKGEKWFALAGGKVGTVQTMNNGVPSVQYNN